MRKIIIKRRLVEEHYDSSLVAVNVNAMKRTVPFILNKDLHTSFTHFKLSTLRLQFRSCLLRLKFLVRVFVAVYYTPILHLVL